MAELSQALERSDAVSAELGARASRASQSGAEQRAAMHEVASTAQELAAVAERLRAAISRFSVEEESPVEAAVAPVEFPQPLTVPEPALIGAAPARRGTTRKGTLRRVG
jgi:hypothetical protein